MTRIHKIVQPLVLHGVFQRFSETPPHLLHVVNAVHDNIFPRDLAALALCDEETLEELFAFEAL